jgi:hypothetical protein
MLLSGELSRYEQAALSWAILRGDELPLEAIEEVNTFPEPRAQYAYAYSHAAVSFLVRTYDISCIPLILDAARKRGSFWRGFEEVIGLQREEFVRLFSSDMRHSYRMAFLLGDSGLIWITLVVLTLAGFVATKLRNARTRKRWREEEQMAVVPDNRAHEEEEEEDDDDDDILGDDIALESDDPEEDTSDRRSR